MSKMDSTGVAWGLVITIPFSGLQGALSAFFSTQILPGINNAIAAAIVLLFALVLFNKVLFPTECKSAKVVRKSRKLP
jgi:hypothetical protein